MPWLSTQTPSAALAVTFEHARVNRIQNVIIEIEELGFGLGDRDRQRLLQAGSDISWIEILRRSRCW
jgi:hypothetical protein